ncbi:MAG: glycine cleavage system aminomethyltransferase GcvT [Candidatus Marinimicrobia bacterium]|nr:glycine cleavage system aminomethyltransferase GcvT [Candidatus Neomarinimicrobiota bacterium]
MKRTPLYNKHVDLNARMVEFFGYNMPIQYTSIVEEHNAVRNSCGIFDVSHMGEFILSGEDAESFLNKMTINDIYTMNPGDAQYSAMCYKNGGIIDDILVYKFDNQYMLVVNASNLEKDFNWLNQHKPDDVIINDVSQETGLIALQGPDSRNILQKVVNVDISKLKFYTFVEDNIDGRNVIIARTGYTGELGYEIYADHDSIQKFWDAIMETGGLIPCGLGCRDTLRMEMKFCLYGNDIDETTNPIEAGLGWITKTGKPDFIGREAVLTAKEHKTRRLIAFEMTERAVPRQGYKLIFQENEIGFVTSGTQSPSLQKGIGLGYVQEGNHKPGTEIGVDIRGKMKKAIIIKPPFYKQGTAHL